MAYLLAKFTLIFLLATLLGAVFGYWWCRRRFVDVTSSHQSLLGMHDEQQKLWRQLWERLDISDASLTPKVREVIAEIPTPAEADFSELERRIDTIEPGFRAALGTIQPPTPEKIDLAPLSQRLDTLTDTVNQLPTPKETDLAPLTHRIEAMRETINALPVPKDTDLIPLMDRVKVLQDTVDVLPVPKDTDLTPLMDRVKVLQDTVDALPPHRSTDLGPITLSIGALQKAIEGLPNPTPAADLTPIQDRCAGISRQISDLSQRKETPAVDLQPLTLQLQQLGERVDNLPERFTCKATTPPPSAAPVAGPKLFKTEDHGPKDDLKLISGVGPKLERLLNANGVYYFWQVASWNREDVDFIDDRLDVFKGRILRDAWVSQAQSLKRQDGAAPQPR
ncbi:MAG: hypothetical protein AB8B96_02150 [Lysobacterales bacterium]